MHLHQYMCSVFLCVFLCVFTSKNVIRVKLANSEVKKGMLLERLVELFGKKKRRVEISPLQFRYDKLPPVVIFDDLMQYLL
uniref:Uncharacterized protein n=1 Tax=Octopus bimaculoides TaxID=37653 RepID=A0A0L8HMG7_OCTBM